MLIAKIENNKITIKDYRAMFPNVSFPSTGPDAQWMQDNGCMGVTVFKPHDRVTQKLVDVEPYIEDGQVFTVSVAPLSSEEIEANQAAAATAAREQAKAERQATVDAIKVTTAAGHTFDGDETSQTRMARAILALQATGTPSVSWVLADNTVIQATAAELIEALALAGAAQAAVWVIE